jgi:hypothetical protein
MFLFKVILNKGLLKNVGRLEGCNVGKLESWKVEKCWKVGRLEGWKVANR